MAPLWLILLAAPQLTVSPAQVRLDGKVVLAPIPGDELLNLPALEEALRATQSREVGVAFTPDVTFKLGKRVLFTMASAGTPASAFSVGALGSFAIEMGGSKPLFVPVTTESEPATLLATLRPAAVDPQRVITFSVADAVSMERLARIMRAAREAGHTRQAVSPASVAHNPGHALASDAFAGPPGADGPVDKEVLRRVIHANRGAVRSCYEAALEAQPGLQGKLVADFVIGPAGNVASATPGEDTMKVPALSRCVLDALKTWNFPKPRSGGVVKVSYPFIFKLDDASK